MSLQFSVLASGSTGNALYLETDDHAFLVDAGLSGKAMEGLMAQIDRKLDQLDGIFVTHEHSDHIKGLGVLARKYEICPFTPMKKRGRRWKGISAKWITAKSSFFQWKPSSHSAPLMSNRSGYPMMPQSRCFTFFITMAESSL